MKIIGQPATADDPRYGTNPLRIQHRPDVIDLIEEFTHRHTKKELMTLLGGQVPFGPVYNVQDIFADPHFRARDMLVSLEHPGRSQPVEVAGVPVKLTDTPGGVYRRAPLLGEHTSEVLAGLGLEHPSR
jgi:crotonobetainyl-CoA:carnitine CoA-transferase CaiB-like acyl-CoA transferase